ncbi:MAG: AraC family transcriptional regulator ligand-binding domain-containing protein, partial [Myxococcales bacterium]|nr:AraC family transcriptional regulator ligand-binding domain-containing protein [Myxococcales bacterium]
MAAQSKAMVEPTFSVHLTRAFVKALKNHPAMPPGLIESLNLDVDPEERTPVSKAERRLKAAVEFTGDKQIGLKAALSSEPGDFEVLEYTVYSAGTPREAYECFIRYMRLLNDAARFRLETEGDRAYLEMATSIPMSQTSVEFMVGAVCVGARRWLNERPPFLEVWFTHAEPNDMSAYRAVFGEVPLVFGAPKNALVIDAQLLDEPQKTADTRLHHVLRRHADQLLEELPRTDSLSERVRKHILDTMPDGSVSADRVASLLNVSRRTLTRHLAEEGTTFRDLLEDTRQRMAEHYLTTTHMSASMSPSCWASPKPPRSCAPSSAGRAKLQRNSAGNKRTSSAGGRRLRTPASGRSPP